MIDSEMKQNVALQDQFGPHNSCFGCGPANSQGLQIKSFVSESEQVTADWHPLKKYEAFPGIICGGIVGTLLDCHSNWTAAWHLYNKSGKTSFPYTVTAEFSVELIKPTSSNGKIHLVATVSESSDRKAVIQSKLLCGEEVTAKFSGTFVAVKSDHPAYGRW